MAKFLGKILIFFSQSKIFKSITDAAPRHSVEVTDKFAAQLLCPREINPVTRRLVGLRNRVGRCEEGTEILPMPRFEPRTVQPVA